MALLVESVTYGAINTTNAETDGSYFIMFTSKPYALQVNTTTYRKL